MSFNNKQDLIRGSIKSILHDYKVYGKISDITIDSLNLLPNKILIELIERLGHQFILKEYDCTSNEEIIYRLVYGIGMDDISHICFKHEGTILFKTGHEISRKGNKLILKNNFEQSIIFHDIKDNIESTKYILENYLEEINKYKKFNDINFVLSLTQALFLN